MHGTIGLKGFPFMCILGWPYNNGGLLPVGLSLLYCKILSKLLVYNLDGFPMIFFLSVGRLDRQCIPIELRCVA